MASPTQQNTRDRKALLIGLLFILLIGVYFIGKRFFYTNTTDRNDVLEAAISDSTKGNIPSIEPAILMKKIQLGEKITMLDIRTRNAFDNEHIAHSRNISINNLENITPDSSTTFIIISDESDNTTFETAKNILARKSFPYFFLKGGINGWKNIYAPMISQANTESFVDQSKVTYIDLEAFKKMQKELASFFLLDVKTEKNYAKKHIQGSINIPLSELEKRATELPVATLIIVYGENDTRSFEGGVLLSDLGIFTAKTLSGSNKHLLPESGLTLEP